MKQQSRVILTALSQSHQPLINSQWRSSRVSGQRKLRCNSTRSPAPLKGNQTTEAPRLQLSSHLSPYAHRSHHVRRDNIECVRHLRAARRASLVRVFSCHVAYILFPILHFSPTTHVLNEKPTFPGLNLVTRKKRSETRETQCLHPVSRISSTQPS